MEVHYYAQITDDGICCGVSQLSGIVNADNMIELESYDLSVMGMKWTGNAWIEDPNPPEPVEPITEPTMSDLSDKLDSQKSLQLAAMQGQADQYTAALAMQAQIDAQQQLNLATMQGLADIYTTLLAMQTPAETEGQ